MPFQNQKIRQLREEQDLTLQELASQCGLTCSYLSKIERAMQAPPVATLQAICDALGIDLQELFTAASPRNAFSRNLDVVFYKNLNLKSLMKTDAVYSYQPLVGLLKKKYMLPFLMLVRKGKTKFFKHDGEEFAFVVEGAVSLFYEGKVVPLKRGDSVYFDSRRPHAFEVKGSTKAVLLSVNYPYRRF